MKSECYEFIRGETGKPSIVGFGSYGEVKLARNTQTSEMVVIKTIYNRKAKEQIDVHHKLNHPNVIKLLNYFYEENKNVTYMVLEYAPNGSLNDRIRNNLGNLKKEVIQKYFKDICLAVQYLHHKKFMHRDIKPENILISKEDRAKLCDFGFTTILEYRNTQCGTFEYMAPEMILQKPYDEKVDIWALGILLFQLVQGVAPFRGSSGSEVLSEMKKVLPFSNRFEPNEIDLIKKILRVKAHNRISIVQILEHPYFKTEIQNKTPCEIKTPTEKTQSEVLLNLDSQLSSRSDINRASPSLKPWKNISKVPHVSNIASDAKKMLFGDQQQNFEVRKQEENLYPKLQTKKQMLIKNNSFEEKDFSKSSLNIALKKEFNTLNINDILTKNTLKEYASPKSNQDFSLSVRAIQRPFVPIQFKKISSRITPQRYLPINTIPENIARTKLEKMQQFSETLMEKPNGIVPNSPYYVTRPSWRKK